MNDLMTKSFMDYAELKKEAMQEPMSDLEKGRESKEYHDKKYFEEVKLVEVEIEELDILLHDLKPLMMKLDLKSTTNNETTNNKIITILQKAKSVKATLEWLYKANPDQVSITGGLRARLRRVVKDLWSLKDQGFEPAANPVHEDWKPEDLEKGEERTKELEELFVEMALWVELNGEDDEEIRSIEGEDCVGRTEGSFCGDGVGLYLAERMKKQRKNWKCWVGLLLLLVLVSLLAILAQ